MTATILTPLQSTKVPAWLIFVIIMAVIIGSVAAYFHCKKKPDYDVGKYSQLLEEDLQQCKDMIIPPPSDSDHLLERNAKLD